MSDRLIGGGRPEASFVTAARAKVAAGAPGLSFEDGLRLYESPDIFTLGELANEVRERLHGRNAYYNINLHINYSNYCVLRCKFCSFYRPYEKGSRGSRDRGIEGGSDEATKRRSDGGEKEGIEGSRDQGIKGGRDEGTEGRRGEPTKGSYELQVTSDGGADAGDASTPSRFSQASQGVQPQSTIGNRQSAIGNPQSPIDNRQFDTDGGYELGIEEIVRRAKAAYARGATEVHIVGGLHPKLPFSYYTDMCSAIRDACPHMHIKAFTAIEIIHFTRITRPRLSIEEVLARLRDAGLGSLPGGGAEIFDDRVHDEAFKNKVGEAEWFDVHRAAHELGIFTNATMLYGHVETPAERIRHLIKLRDHQAQSLRNRKAHFNCVIPLSFIPEGSALEDVPGPGGLDDLKTLALSRLMCHNIPHLKAFWIMQSPKLAQVSLDWGVDDIDGTVVYYDITKREGHGSTHQELTVDRLRRLIAEAGCKPVERDTIYRRVIRDGRTWRVTGAGWSVPYHTGPGDGLTEGSRPGLSRFASRPVQLTLPG